MARNPSDSSDDEKSRHRRRSDLRRSDDNKDRDSLRTESRDRGKKGSRESSDEGELVEREKGGRHRDRLSSDGEDDARERRDRTNGHRSRRETEDRSRDRDRDREHRSHRRNSDEIDYRRSGRGRVRADDEKHSRHREEDNRRDAGGGKPTEETKSGITVLDEGNPNTGSNLGKSGGVYIPPYKLARMMKDVQDKSSVEYQRLTWDALRKSINGLVNKVNATNIKNIIPELFAENLIRGRGLFCRSCMKSQMASPTFTDVFAGLVSVVNTKFPEVGELLLRRIVLQLKRAYKRNDKPQLLAAVKFIAHLVNQQVAHEIIALELLAVLLENPTDDSVEVAVGFVTECGSLLQDVSPKGLDGQGFFFRIFFPFIFRVTDQILYTVLGLQSLVATEESERILKRARRRKRKHCTIIID